MSVHSSSDSSSKSLLAKGGFTFFVTITRTGPSSGTLSYQGTISHTCGCQWNPATQMPAGTFPGCSATYMGSATGPRGKREGIFIPNVPNRVGIFVHYMPAGGALNVWSQGCTVIADADMVKIWNDINPKDGKNVTVTVEDKIPTR